MSLVALPTTAGFAVATAIIEDGGIAAYRLRFTLQEHAGRWLVSSGLRLRTVPRPSKSIDRSAW